MRAIGVMRLHVRVRSRVLPLRARLFNVLTFLQNFYSGSKRREAVSSQTGQGSRDRPISVDVKSAIHDEKGEVRQPIYQSSLFTMKGIPFVAYAVTSLHVGMGRSSGVVDLPIQRDPQGFPIIFSSTFKGALKQYCGTVYNAINDNGRIDCSKANVCCCLFGGEGEADVTSIISISDLYPIAIPVPSLDRGYVYLTSKYLINAVVDLFSAVNYEEGVKLLSSLVSQSGGSQGEATIGTDIKVPLFKVTSSLLDTLSNLGSIAKKMSEGIAVEEDDSRAVLEIERGIIKYTRNRINLNTKTVSTGSLWTEEYLPHGSIFAGIMFLNTPRRNKYCNGDKMCDDQCAYQKVNEFIKNKEFYLNVGGKETIGKGIVKVRILGDNNE